MAQEIINNGTFDNDPSAEKIRTAFDKTNNNFTELYDDKVDKTGDTMTGDLRFNDNTIIELGTNLASRLFSSGALTRLDLFTDNFVIRDYTSGSLQGNRFAFTQAGNLGIGTLSPNTLLDVSSVNTGATAPTVRITNTLESSNWGGFTDDLGRFEFFTDDESGNAPYTLGYVGIKNDRIGTGSLPSGAMIFATTPYNASGGSVERMRINSDGEVGIGTSNPSEKLHVIGNILASGDITAFSDSRIKENIETLPNALESVKQMRGVTYNKIGEEKQSIGVIAQEVQSVLPELVSEHNDGMLSVAYGNITAVLIEAIKEQQNQIDNLKSKLDGFTN